MNLPQVKLLERSPSLFALDPTIMERDLEAYIDEDPYPIPPTERREGHSGPRHFDYWLSGLNNYLRIKQVMPVLQSPALEFGSATGRVLRHFVCHEPWMDLYATDINQDHIAWLHEFIPQIHGSVNGLTPPLPCEDNKFGLAMGFSVFTHIADHEIAWLHEIYRVLRPGGMGYFTVVTDHTWDHMDKASWGVYGDLVRNRPKYHGMNFRNDIFDHPMPFDKTVFQYTNRTDGYGVVVFHKTDYIRRVWGEIFEIVDIIREGHHFQDVVVLRKR